MVGVHMATSAIQMSYAKNVVSRTMHGTFQELSFAARVRNVGFGKRVAFHWCGEDGVWTETPAEFRAALPDGDELWGADLAVPLTRDSAIPGNVQFAACLEHDGQKQWDSRGGENYRSDADSGAIVFEPVDVLAIGVASRLPDGLVSLPVEVAVRQALAPEAVIVHWTDDGWATQHAAPAYFRRNHWDRRIGSNARNPNRYGWGVWAARLPLRQAYRVEFAVECRTKTGAVWDNRGGLNHRTQRGTLKVLTLNLHTYQEENQLEKFATIARAIRERGIDLVCFQEVGEHWNDGAGDWASNAARLINEQLPAPYHLPVDWSHLGFERFREGVAILSRHPFVFTDSGYVSDNQDPYDIHSRKIVMAQVQVPYFGLVNVFSAHLSWPSGGFYPQFERLQKWADDKQTPETTATLVCGDFNVPAGSEAYRAIVDTGEFEDQYLKIAAPPAFQKIFRERTGDAAALLARDGRIDYLWLRRGDRLRAIAAEELFTPARYGRVSDHAGYEVEFELR